MHRYDLKTEEKNKIDYPTDEILVFDVETLVLEENRPVIAIALSSDAWYLFNFIFLFQNLNLKINLQRYSWCSPCLFDKNYSSKNKLTFSDLIPLESQKEAERLSKKRLVIGHNVGFDRSYIKEQYFLKVCLYQYLKLRITLT